MQVPILSPCVATRASEGEAGDAERQAADAKQAAAAIARRFQNRGSDADATAGMPAWVLSGAAAIGTAGPPRGPGAAAAGTAVPTGGGAGAAVVPGGLWIMLEGRPGSGGSMAGGSRAAGLGGAGDPKLGGAGASRHGPQQQPQGQRAGAMAVLRVQAQQVARVLDSEQQQHLQRLPARIHAQLAERASADAGSNNTARRSLALALATNSDAGTAFRRFVPAPGCVVPCSAGTVAFSYGGTRRLCRSPHNPSSDSCIEQPPWMMVVVCAKARPFPKAWLTPARPLPSLAPAAHMPPSPGATHAVQVLLIRR